MEETVGSLDKEQLTRLAQYFDEKVTYPPKYKRSRAAIPRSPERRSFGGRVGAGLDVTRSCPAHRTACNTGSPKLGRAEHDEGAVETCQYARRPLQAPGRTPQERPSFRLLQGE